MVPIDNWRLSFPESPYAQELARGTSELQFSNALEGPYRTRHLERVKSRVRIWFTFALGLALALTFESAMEYGIANALTVVYLSVEVPAALLLVYLSWSGAYERHFLQRSRQLVLLYSVLLAIFIARGTTDGRGEELAQLTLNLFAVFFFCGLLYQDAVIVGSLALVAYILAGLWDGMPLSWLLSSLPVLVLAALTAALVKRDIEKAYRRNYLEGALLGELVARDGLTGLMNRRAFDEHLQRVWQQCLRDKRPLGILLIDIDHFKRYNDSYGHLAGDTALRRVGHVIQQFSRRPLDMAARYGGEEFVVILYDLPLAHVEDLAERLRVSIAQQTADNQGVQSLSAVSASIGVGYAIPALGRAPEGIVQLADEALYEAKLAGRNRVIVKGADAYQSLKTGAFPRSAPL